MELAKLRAKKLSPNRRKQISDVAIAARHASLTAEERSEIARKGAEARLGQGREEEAVREVIATQGRSGTLGRHGTGK